MDYFSHNLETAQSSKSVVDNGDKMSFETTEVLPNNNNNKENSEIFADFMVCDDDSSIEDDVDVRKDENNQSITDKLPPESVTDEIPPKYDILCSEVLSTFASPKSKKRKVSSFDELLENLQYNIMVMNFTKLLDFLESNNKELTFPFIVKDYEELFEMIVLDINILKSKSLDTNYRDICDKIIVAATGYSLMCVYEYSQDFQKMVMVIKKENNNMMDKSRNGTSSFSCSRQIVKLSSQTASEVDSNKVLSRSPSPGPISSGFKIHCLRTTLAFLKNDITKTKEFPELNLEQAQFMQLLLESVVAFTEFDSNLEIKELYRALWEAVRIYSLKYEFRIKCVESSGDKKSLVFEKVPKQKPSVTAFGSNHLLNPKTDVLKTDALKQEASNKEAPKPEAPKSEASKRRAPEYIKSEAPMPDALKPNALKPEAPKPECPKPEASKTNAPEDSKSEASKPEAPVPDALKPGSLKPEAPKSVALKPEASNTGAPKPEAPKAEATKRRAPEDTKSEAPMPDALKPNALKPEAPKPECPKPEGSKTNSPKDSKSEVSKPEAPKPDALKPEALKPGTLKPEAPKSVASKPKPSEVPIPAASKSEASKSKPSFPMPKIPKCLPLVKRKPIRVTKRNVGIFIKRLPSKFISETLNTFHDFLLDEDRFQLVFVPNTHSELDFYRKCLSWCQTSFAVSKFGDEFQEMHYQISCLLSLVNCTVTKPGASKFNETTGIKEVTYIKVGKKLPNVSIPDTAQSVPKKKKINLQNALQLAGIDKIKLASVVNLNESLRNKKKNKKLKKARLAASAGARKEAFVKPSQAKTWSDGSSSICSSRGTSRERSKVDARRAKRMAQRALNEFNKTAKNSFRESSRSRRGEETTRKEQLIEALSVPVQSDKAMRMMRGMGWSGGALGARGDGITEPLMPTLDLARGAGLGHSRNTQTEGIAMKPRKSRTSSSFIPKNSNTTTDMDKTENDLIVQKTKQLLLDNPTFDSIMKETEPVKPKACNVEFPKSRKLEKLSVELSQPTKPLPTQTKTTVELPKPKKANVKLPEPSTSNPKQLLKPLPTLTKYSIELQKPGNSHLEFPPPFRQQILHSILELLSSDRTSKTLTYEKKINKKSRNFVNTAVKAVKSGSNYGLCQQVEHDIYSKILNKYKNQPIFTFEAFFSNDCKSVELIKKEQTEFETPPQQELSIITQLSLKVNTEIISEKDIHSYISSSGTHYDSEKAYETLKFKVLFLLNILSFVKSLNEEVEVTFSKVLNVKQKAYIENVIDEVNMRIKFGSSPAEHKLCAEIKNHVKGAFLGFLFNHQYTVVTLSKYFRFKRLNRPDNAVKRTCQTEVNLDDFSSETFSKAKLNTNAPNDKENNSKVAENINKVAENTSKVTESDKKDGENNHKVTENNAVALPEEPEGNELEPYDDDNFSDEEYNRNNCSVPKLSLDDGVNLTKFLYLYDKEKTNTAGFKNNSNINIHSASKHNSNVTENRNKNNIGNGNVVIDNNDRQIIDMKRDGGNTKKENNIVDTEMADYVMCVDYTEEVVNSGGTTVDINKEKEINITEYKKKYEETDQLMKHSEMVVLDDVVEIVNQHEEIGIDNIDNMINEVISNTEDTIDQNVIVIEDSDSNDCTENIVKEEIQNSGNPSKNDKVIKEDTDVIMIEINDEPMEAINITEECIELINQGESIEEIVKVESSKDVEVAKMEEESSINPTDDQIVKEDLGIKTDGEIILKEKLVLSESICDTHLLGLSRVKTVGTTDVPDFVMNKDTEIKNVRIVHRNHPIRKLTNEEVKAIQIHIHYRIARTTQLPSFKCHGVQNGALLYTCHNKKSYDWLQNTNSDGSYVNVLDTEITKMALKFYCFFNVDTKDFFRMIELYNHELTTKDWVVEKRERDGDYVILIVSMDKFSVKFIQESDFALFAGIDKVQFSLIWE